MNNGIAYKPRKEKPVIENTIETYLKSQVELCGGMCEKWIAGRDGVPDRIVVLNGNTVFIELKRPGDKPRELQVSVINRLKNAGAEVYVIDTKAKVDSLIKKLNRKGNQNETHRKKSKRHNI